MAMQKEWGGHHDGYKDNSNNYRGHHSRSDYKGQITLTTNQKAQWREADQRRPGNYSEEQANVQSSWKGKSAGAELLGMVQGKGERNGRNYSAAAPPGQFKSCNNRESRNEEKDYWRTASSSSDSPQGWSDNSPQGWSDNSPQGWQQRAPVKIAQVWKLEDSTGETGNGLQQRTPLGASEKTDDGSPKRTPLRASEKTFVPSNQQARLSQLTDGKGGWQSSSGKGWHEPRTALKSSARPYAPSVPAKLNALRIELEKPLPDVKPANPVVDTPEQISKDEDRRTRLKSALDVAVSVVEQVVKTEDVNGEKAPAPSKWSSPARLVTLSIEDLVKQCLCPLEPGKAPSSVIVGGSKDQPECLSSSHESCRKALSAFDGTAYGKDYLNFVKGDLILHLDREEEGWHFGAKVTMEGMRICEGWYPPEFVDGRDAPP